jgi:ADP-heptose:LPS heptosyltransferase
LERTPRVTVDCHPRLASLLKRAYPQLEAVLAPNAISAATCAHIAMGDIAGVLKLGREDVAAAPLTMQAPERVHELREKYLTLAKGRPVVGIAWASPMAKLARAKRAALEHWGALLREPYFFVSLQYGDDRADIAAAREAFGGDIYRDESVDQMRSIEDFAAQLAALDQIVTISNTTAHVAGALGLRALVLLPPAHGLHWYWGHEGETTPWYPTLTLERRTLNEEWPSQIADAAGRVRNALLP